MGATVGLELDQLGITFRTLSSSSMDLIETPKWQESTHSENNTYTSLLIVFNKLKFSG